MSPSCYKTDKLSRNEARKQIQKIIAAFPNGIIFSGHSLIELKKDNLTTIDAWNVLNSADSKIYDDGEFSNGSYRYRVETSNIVIVVTFSTDGKGMIIVTAWDKRKKRGK